MQRMQVSASSSGTRDLILRTASNLIAVRGYRATTTRQIAQSVGIQQPSLFHHFASKAEIVGELLTWDLSQSLPVAERIVARPLSAPVRLYAYLRWDVDHLMNAPYNLAGVFTEDVMSDPVFAPWAGQRDQVHKCVQRIVADGVTAGDFIAVNPGLVSEAVAGVLVGVLTFHSGGRQVEPDFPDEVATILVRGLTVDTAALPSIRADACDELQLD